jgi:CheY-like chemotaxis protein
VKPIILSGALVGSQHLFCQELTGLLEGKRILVLEDEPLVAMLLEEILLDLGCTVVGPAYSLAEGLRLAETEPLDGALLDVNLNGDLSDGVAEILRERGVRYALATGYGSSPELNDDPDVPVLQKPYPADKVEAVLRQLIAD